MTDRINECYLLACFVCCSECTVAFSLLTNDSGYREYLDGQKVEIV